MDALRVPRAPTSLLDRIVEDVRRLLGDDLVGLYLHGSLAFGCFNPARSDIDFLVVVRDRLDPEIKRRLAHILLDLSRAAPAKGLEMSVLTRASLRQFRYPTPYEFHFSKLWIDRYEADAVDFETERIDPDLAAHLTVTRERGVCLFGAPIEHVVSPIPRRAYLQSIAADSAVAGHNIVSDPVYGVLNLCRTLAFIAEGLIVSKAEGGEWAMRQVPASFVPVLRAALELYAGVEQPGGFDEWLLHAFAEYTAREIERALDGRCP
jgi:predicted nucleotidyltransferase